ncbi:MULTISPECIES: GNAT family N-acetyltransferase [unclassified Flavobacterium]|uniref:GNAT family N-acetyltransferase n=1 Tax=unclassified Flavobacterium TaxID=196869 RepID=UPI0036170179
MEIKDNTFSRQFEILATEGVITVEYSLQERKIFLTRINTPEHFDNEPYLDEIIRQILTIAEEKKWRVVPIFPRIASFFRKNPAYKSMLPPGIRI